MSAKRIWIALIEKNFWRSVTLMIGEGEQANPIATNLLLADAEYLIENAKKYGGKICVAKKIERNFAQPKVGKVVVQFRILFSKEKDMNQFLAEIEP